MPKAPSNIFQIYGFIVGVCINFTMHVAKIVNDFTVLILFIAPAALMIISLYTTGYWREKILGRKLNIKTTEKDFQEIDRLSRDNASNKQKLRLVYASIKLMMLAGGFLISNIVYMIIYKVN